MSENENTEATRPEPAEGTWQATMVKSAVLNDRAVNGKRKASALLWDATVQGVTEWLKGADSDVSAEGLYGEVLDLLGKARKGDASKIRTVALAVRENGLDMAAHANLSQAYNAAVALTKTKAKHDAEDEAVESAAEMARSNAPKTASKPEAAALIVIGQGADEAARLLLDALGKTNTEAHRGFLRAVAQELAGRIKPEPKPKPAKKAAAPKGSKAAKKAAPAKATVKKAAAKPAPAERPATKKAAAPKSGGVVRRPVKRAAAK